MPYIADTLKLDADAMQSIETILTSIASTDKAKLHNLLFIYFSQLMLIANGTQIQTIKKPLKQMSSMSNVEITYHLTGSRSSRILTIQQLLFS